MNDMAKRYLKALIIVILMAFPMRPSFSQGLEPGLQKQASLNLKGCVHGEQTISQWIGDSLINLEGEFRHDDQKNHIKATIKKSDSKQTCKVTIYTYVEGADTAFECSFPLSVKEFKFPAILKGNQAWELFDEQSLYCHYTH